MEHEPAFRRLFDLHFAEIFRYVYRHVHSAEEAKDLVHDAFLRIWQKRDEVDLAGPSARSFLYTIARYRCLDHLRHRRIEERCQHESAMPEEAEAPDPQEELTSQETAAAIQRAVDSLPPRQREILQLRWQRQASYDKIAQALGISPKTVAVHISRALQHLREMLADVR
jgi:RNA polymerase sigma-70 factor (ECF subfamily)